MDHLRGAQTSRSIQLPPGSSVHDRDGDGGTKTPRESNNLNSTHSASNSQLIKKLSTTKRSSAGSIHALINNHNNSSRK